MPDSQPLISVIIATYNRSNLLRYAIESVLASTYTNWELIVIGDCCTDDTESVVNSFSNPRITFKNLEVNSGQQATPNNIGLSMAKGKYIAFLNHDDMYFPTHLETSYNTLLSTSSQIVCSPYFSIEPGTPSKLACDEYGVSIKGAPRKQNQYSPHQFHVASTWFFSREVIDTVGMWVTEKKSYVTPSKEWLFRAWKKGIRIHVSDKISVLAILSGNRPGSYTSEGSYEHEYFFKHVILSDSRERILELAAVQVSSKLLKYRFYQPISNLSHFLAYPIFRLLERLSIHPQAFVNRIRYGKKGNFIKKVREKTGLKS